MEGRVITSELALETYLKDINKTKLLSAEEEKILAERLRNGDMLAREEMIKANLRLVVNIAKRYSNFGLPYAGFNRRGQYWLTKGGRAFRSK